MILSGHSTVETKIVAPAIGDVIMNPADSTFD